MGNQSLGLFKLILMSELTVYLRHAKRSSAVNLDLSKKSLGFIPKEVFTIKTIEVLNLADNKIASIQTSITDLYRMRELNLINNALTEIPEQLISLPSLKILHLKGNPLGKKFVHLLELSPDKVVEAIQDCFGVSQSHKSVKAPSWLSDTLPDENPVKGGSEVWETNTFKKEPIPMLAKTTSQFRKPNLPAIEPECELKNGVLELRVAELQINEQISQGGFSTIHRGSYMGLEVAAKKIFNPNITEESLKEFNNELAMLTKYRHPNIVLLIGAITTPPNLCIVMEYVRDGTLYDSLYKKKAQLGEVEKRKIVKQIISVLNYLHRHNIVHRDIKSHNVLLSAGNVRLCDFGLARHKSDLNTGPMQFSGTPTYMAQELFQKKYYNESVDVFALGTLLYEIYAGEIPYQGLDPADIKDRVLKDSSLSKGTVKKSIIEIINRCRRIEVEERPTMAELQRFEDW